MRAFPINRSIAFLALACLGCDDVYANDDLFEVRGFGTIGIVSHNSNALEFHRDLFQDNGISNEELTLSELSVLGLQIDTRRKGPFDFTMQIVASAGIDYKLDDAVKLAAVSYEPNASLQFRLGRLKPRRFLNSETKNIGFSQLWTMPVHETYAITPNDFVNGAEVNISHPLYNGFFRGNLGYGKFKLKGKELSGDENLIEFDKHLTFNIEYELNGWLFRLGYTTAEITDVKNDIDDLINGLRQLGGLTGWQEAIQLGNDLDMRGAQSEFYSAGLMYQNGIWEVTAETTLTKAESTLVPHVIGSYLSIGYRINQFTPYVLIANAADQDEQVTLSAAPPPVPGANELAFAGLLATNLNVDQRSISLGIKYDINHTSAFKFQIDSKTISENGSALWAIENRATFTNQKEDVTVYSATYEFVF